jgi:hypothetical protein
LTPVAQAQQRIPVQARQHADLHQCRHLDGHLQDAAHQHRESHGVDGLFQKGATNSEATMKATLSSTG